MNVFSRTLGETMIRNFKLISSAVVSLLLTLSLTACGGPARDTPAAALKSAYTILQEGKTQQFCDDYITKEGLGLFAVFTDGCPPTMENKGIPQGKITIDESLIELDGDQATARRGVILVDGEPAGDGWKMVKQDGQWYLFTYL